MSERAKKFAVAAHGAQRYGKHPYVVHLAAVAGTAEEYGAPAQVREAAWLHDVLEDTAITFSELEDIFGREVAELVDAVTTKDAENRAAAHALTYPAMRQAGSLAVLLKLCDRLANVRASAKSSAKKLEMYKSEYAYFYEVLYLPGEHEELWAALNELLED